MVFDKFESTEETRSRLPALTFENTGKNFIDQLTDYENIISYPAELFPCRIYSFI